MVNEIVIRLSSGLCSKELQEQEVYDALKAHERKLAGILDRSTSYSTCARYEHKLNAIGEALTSLKKAKTETSPRNQGT